jgi:hypothetical protein
MIVGLFKELLGWFINLAEVGLAIAAVLLVGLVIGMAGFRILSRIMRLVSGPPPVDPSDEDEPDGTESGGSEPRDTRVGQ